MNSSVDWINYDKLIRARIEVKMQIWKKISAIIFGIIPVGLSGCALFEQRVLPPPRIDPDNAWTDAQGRILSGFASELQFKLPEFNDQNLDLFKYINSRAISITATRQNRNNPREASVVFGTGWIIGAANQATTEGRDLAFYVLTNVHVANNFWNQLGVNWNIRSESFGFGYSPFFKQYLINGSLPTEKELSGRSGNSLLNFSTDIDSDYAPIGVDSRTFHWNANNFSIQDFDYATAPFTADTIRTKQGLQSSYEGVNFSADAAVIEINLAPAYRYASRTNDVLLKRYIEYVSETVAIAQADTPFGSADNSAGFLSGYPSVRHSRWVANSTSIINIQLNPEIQPRNRILLTPSRNIDEIYTDSLLDVQIDPTRIQRFASPVSEYGVQGLNIGAGSSGTALIGYQPDKPANQRFSINGIYWGGLESETSPTNFEGRISRFVVPNRYDLIGITKTTGSVTASTPVSNNSLCDYIATQPGARKLNYC
ncbi:hypothetical protein J2Z62_000464 [Mycoplasmoides fastidiosum]|uniref:DUF31 domain-containing protein n=1 Tax=Mycoplasmoides fastidiosum TaxID=92758 RepID=A0ABU0LZ95_9BACT|nr:DUF31 family protein [Mycoplasmoides fastidiosum]MDQ0514026.1 hypothetical protein [Mycoplasmoides fastidiosum]UUD37564.1 DUF31 family protein [Mycoplasmoides fastidiosum]